MREADFQTRRFYLPGRKVVKEDDILGWSDIPRCPPDGRRRLRHGSGFVSCACVEEGSPG